LVTVRRVTSSIYLNSNHDLITIDGWKVVVKRTKGIVEGDWVVFLEADCFVPAHGRFAKFDRLFAEIGELTTYDGAEGYRVGMSTWRDHQGKQVVSQGHVFALREFPHIEDKVFELRWERSRTHTDEQFLNYLRTVDFRNGLDVKKWESPDDKFGLGIPPHLDMELKGTGTEGTASSNDNAQQQHLTVITFPKYPHFILKPDMERVQNCPNLFLKPKYRTYLFQESVKLDGASMTVYFLLPTSPSYSHLPTLPALSPASILTHPLLQHAVQQLGRFGVCSRKHDLVPHMVSPATTPAQQIYWTAALAAKLHVSLPAGAAAGCEHGHGSIAVQGELVGASIQGNPYGYAKGEHEFVIYAVYDVDRRKRWDPRKVVEFAERIGVRHVPVRGYHRIWDVARNHEDLVVRAELRNAEGLVWKNVLDGRWFKVLSSRWVLEKEKARAREGKSLKGQVQGKEGRVTTLMEKGEDKNKVVADWEIVNKQDGQVLMEIFRDLENWMKRDDGVRKWMEEWKREYYGDDYVVGKGMRKVTVIYGSEKNGLVDGNGVAKEEGKVEAHMQGIKQEVDGGESTDSDNTITPAYKKQGETGKKVETAALKQKTSKLAEWLGIEGFGL
jgi:hypothetical protein